MIELHSVHQGDSPLVVSVPHDGRFIPDDIRERMTPEGRDMPDTDWHVARLYEFARGQGATVIVANYSRYVVDLNRPGTDEELYEGQVATGVCPQQSFSGEDIYKPGESADANEQAGRVRTFWEPYHMSLQALLDAAKLEHGYALLWDAHSISSRVPRLFDGELPELNIGTYDARSCGAELAAPVVDVAAASPYSSVRDQRFKGGHITRHYGQPEDNVHAIQLEISQRAYMDEHSREFDESRANSLRDTLSRMIDAFIDAARHNYQ